MQEHYYSKKKNFNIKLFDINSIPLKKSRFKLKGIERHNIQKCTQLDDRGENTFTKKGY